MNQVRLPSPFSSDFMLSILHCCFKNHWWIITCRGTSFRSHIFPFPVFKSVSSPDDMSVTERVLTSTIPYWNVSIIFPFEIWLYFCFISGIEGELYYVRGGEINRYAMTFNMLIKQGIHDLYFTWQNLLSPPEPPVSNRAVFPSRYYIDVSISLQILHWCHTSNIIASQITAISLLIQQQKTTK